MCPQHLSQLVEITLASIGTKGCVSKYYSLLAAHSNESTLDKLHAWKIDKQEDVDERDWYDAYLKAQKQTINTKFQLIQYMWLMRMYITPVILHHVSQYLRYLF